MSEEQTLIKQIVTSQLQFFLFRKQTKLNLDFAMYYSIWSIFLDR